jgi:hypothetical protein
MAPVVFASIKRFKLIGASNSLSNDLLFLSNVIVTASIDVVPGYSAAAEPQFRNGWSHH